MEQTIFNKEMKIKFHKSNGKVVDKSLKINEMLGNESAIIEYIKSLNIIESDCIDILMGEKLIVNKFGEFFYSLKSAFDSNSMEFIILHKDCLRKKEGCEQFIASFLVLFDDEIMFLINLLNPEIKLKMNKNDRKFDLKLLSNQLNTIIFPKGYLPKEIVIFFNLKENKMSDQNRCFLCRRLIWKEIRVTSTSPNPMFLASSCPECGRKECKDCKKKFDKYKVGENVSNHCIFCIEELREGGSLMVVVNKKRKTNSGLVNVGKVETHKPKRKINKNVDPNYLFSFGIIDLRGKLFYYSNFWKLELLNSEDFDLTKFKKGQFLLKIDRIKNIISRINIQKFPSLKTLVSNSEKVMEIIENIKSNGSASIDNLYNNIVLFSQHDEDEDDIVFVGSSNVKRKRKRKRKGKKKRKKKGKKKSKPNNSIDISSSDEIQKLIKNIIETKSLQISRKNVKMIIQVITQLNENKEKEKFLPIFALRLGETQEFKDSEIVNKILLSREKFNDFEHLTKVFKMSKKINTFLKIFRQISLYL